MFPERQYQSGLSVCLKIMSFNGFRFFCYLIQSNSFLWKIYKNQLFQNQWSITKTRTPFCSYCYLPKVNLKKYWKKTFFVSAGAQKSWRAVVSRNTLPQYLPNPKNKFSVTYIYVKYICFTFNRQKSQNDFIKGF